MWHALSFSCGFIVIILSLLALFLRLVVAELKPEPLDFFSFLWQLQGKGFKMNQHCYLTVNNSFTLGPSQFLYTGSQYCRNQKLMQKSFSVLVCLKQWSIVFSLVADASHASVVTKCRIRILSCKITCNKNDLM